MARLTGILVGCPILDRVHSKRYLVAVQRLNKWDDDEEEEGEDEEEEQEEQDKDYINGLRIGVGSVNFSSLVIYCDSFMHTVKISGFFLSSFISHQPMPCRKERQAKLQVLTSFPCFTILVRLQSVF